MLYLGIFFYPYCSFSLVCLSSSKINDVEQEKNYKIDFYAAKFIQFTWSFSSSLAKIRSLEIFELFIQFSPKQEEAISAD